MPRPIVNWCEWCEMEVDEFLSHVAEHARLHQLNLEIECSQCRLRFISQEDYASHFRNETHRYAVLLLRTRANDRVAEAQRSNDIQRQQQQSSQTSLQSQQSIHIPAETSTTTKDTDDVDMSVEYDDNVCGLDIDMYQINEDNDINANDGRVSTPTQTTTALVPHISQVNTQSSIVTFLQLHDSDKGATSDLSIEHQMLYRLRMTVNVSDSKLDQIFKMTNRFSELGLKVSSIVNTSYRLSISNTAPRILNCCTDADNVCQSDGCSTEQRVGFTIANHRIRFAWSKGCQIQALPTVRPHSACACRPRHHERRRLEQWSRFQHTLQRSSSISRSTEC